MLSIVLLSMLLLTTFITYHNYNSDVDTNDKPCGVEASTNLIHSNPWLVVLEYYRRGRKTEIRCGATLITSKYLITAAHCVKKIKSTRLVARLGEYDTSTESDCLDGVCADPVVLINVAEVIIHPDYNGNEHDIAVLRLEHEAPYTDFIRPVCLPSGQLDPSVILVASGFGEIPDLGYYSTTKKIIPLPTWRIEDCQKAYDPYSVPPHFICAGGEEGVDTCRGDSGGPLIWIKDRSELWGVTSAGNIHCGKKGSPGIYTKVIDYLDWIRTEVKNDKI